MAGCYGNHPEDRYFSRMLDAYLAEQTPEVEWERSYYQCTNCDTEWEQDNKTGSDLTDRCPKCGRYNEPYDTEEL